ncbi:hypothetical protein [Streptomyces sp. BpilaLS-43]|uniref:hypothetical protein n=1 Tax=Streptomyces sp. BpilaLS-43 TaxID=1839778 RepID=UPI00351E1DA8
MSFPEAAQVVPRGVVERDEPGVTRLGPCAASLLGGVRGDGQVEAAHAVVVGPPDGLVQGGAEVHRSVTTALGVETGLADVRVRAVAHQGGEADEYAVAQGSYEHGVVAEVVEVGAVQVGGLLEGVRMAVLAVQAQFQRDDPFEVGLPEGGDLEVDSRVAEFAQIRLLLRPLLAGERRHPVLGAAAGQAEEVGPVGGEPDASVGSERLREVGVLGRAVESGEAGGTPVRAVFGCGAQEPGERRKALPGRAGRAEPAVSGAATTDGEGGQQRVMALFGPRGFRQEQVGAGEGPGVAGGVESVGGGVRGQVVTVDPGVEGRTGVGLVLHPQPPGAAVQMGAAAHEGVVERVGRRARSDVRADGAGGRLGEGHVVSGA